MINKECVLNERGGKRNLPDFDNSVVLVEAVKYCIDNNVPLHIPQGMWYTSTKTIIPAGIFIESHGTLVYTNENDCGLLIGDEDKANFNVTIEGLRVKKSINWSNDTIGIELLNLSTCCRVTIPYIDGFRTGLKCHAGGVTKPRSFLYNNLILGGILNNKIGINLHSSYPSSAPNSNVFTGGRIGSWSNAPKEPMYGILFSSSDGAYKGHNVNTFIGQSIELNNSQSEDSIPIKMDCGTRNKFIGIRHETKDLISDVYEDEAGMNDYEFLWAQKKTLTRTSNAIKKSRIYSPEEIK